VVCTRNVAGLTAWSPLISKHASVAWRASMSISFVPAAIASNFASPACC
jgi:hypothetical protein